MAKHSFKAAGKVPTGSVYRGSGRSIQTRGKAKYPTGFSRTRTHKVHPLPTHSMHKSIGEARAARAARVGPEKPAGPKRTFLPAQPIPKRDFGSPPKGKHYNFNKGEQKMKPLKINRGTVSRRAT